MPLFKKLAALAGAAEAARRYARSNPDKASKYLDQAAAFVDKQTKGKYRTQIDGVTKQAKGAAGLPAQPPHGNPTGNGYGQPPAYGHDAPTQAFPPPGTPGYQPPQPGSRPQGA